MPTTNTKISVIMGIYNCAETLGEAIDSLRNQTYPHWKLIMCDDGSSDNTYEIAKQYSEQYPDQIVLLKNDKNMGLNFTLNRCSEYVDTEYIARMDGDDISLPQRFEKEIDFLNNNPNVDFVSCNMGFFDENGTWGHTNATPKPQCKDFLRSTQFCHAPCMIRTNAFRAVSGYSDSKYLLRVEDYHLWVKMYEKGFCGVNLSESLYLMRDDRNAIQRRKFKYRVNEAYVKTLVIKKFHLPFYSYLYCLRPILLGLTPRFIYVFLHKAKHKKH